MNIENCKLNDLKIINPSLHVDQRGYFFESYNKIHFDKKINRNINFVQDNISKSSHGTLRGMHMQKAPFEQAKLIKVLNGEIFDVAVDMRTNSKTQFSWFSIILSSENKKQFWIPEGFAHGFLVLSETAEIEYKVNNYYHQESEISYNYNDPKFKILWPDIDKDYILSNKDKNAPFI